MKMGETSRIWNTFDAHRLLHWAGTVGPAEQRALKEALFRAHFTDNRPLPDADVLAGAAEATGLDRTEAARVLADGRYASEVREAETLWRSRGITAVPAVPAVTFMPLVACVCVGCRVFVRVLVVVSAGVGCCDAVVIAVCHVLSLWGLALSVDAH